MAERQVISGDAEPERGGPDIAGLLISAGLLCLAGLAFWDAAQLGGGPTYSQIGPGVAEQITATGLAILGVLNAILSWRGGFVEGERYDLPAVAFIVIGFAGLIAVIALGLGFILGATIVFASTTLAFGRRSPMTDIVMGFVLSVLIYLAFTKLLTLSLPAGPLERLL